MAKQKSKVNVKEVSTAKLKELLARVRGTQKVKAINELTLRGEGA